MISMACTFHSKQGGNRVITESLKVEPISRTMDKPGYLPLKQAAVWAGVSSRTMKRWLDGGLPSYQAGPRTKVLVRPIDIDEFLTRRQVSQVDIDALVNETVKEMEKDRTVHN